REVEMGGNIGRPALSLAPPAPHLFYVLEISSYQIDLAPSLAPEIGILLNISPDHLDRHGTLDAYVAIKERLVRASKKAIVAVDDAHTVAIADRLEAEGASITRISRERELRDGYFADGADLYRAEAGRARRIASLAGIPSLRGTHNA